MTGTRNGGTLLTGESQLGLTSPWGGGGGGEVRGAECLLLGLVLIYLLLSFKVFFHTTFILFLKCAEF